MAFLDHNFLLGTDTAHRLFQETSGLPIVDYHNHLSPQEICENSNYRSITQFWLAHDHYKWRIMRLAGVPEEYICGNAPDREKFRAFAGACEYAVGSPVYCWANLELRRLFDVKLPLTAGNADLIYDQCGQRLTEDAFRPQELLRRFGVRALCTTDEPDSALEWHKKIAEQGIGIRVSPGFRPDGILKIGSAQWPAHIGALAKRENCDIITLETLKNALELAVNRFADNGAFASDHGFERFVYVPNNAQDARTAFQKALAGHTVSRQECDAFQSHLMEHLGALYAGRGIVMQLHLGALRNANTNGYARLGPDSGYDSVGIPTNPFMLAGYLDALEREGALPNTILYSLHSGDYPALATLAASFGGERPNRVQLGAAWWFNDTERGIREQLAFLMENGMFANTPGMLTDSRSISSFVRHEYYRRIVCDVVGKILERGEYHDYATAKKLLSGVFYGNAAELFLKGQHHA